MKPKPGTIGLARIDGALGWMITVAQATTGDASYWTHVFLVLDDETVIQAMPSGAEIVPLKGYLEPGAALFLHDWPEVTEEQRKNLFVEARKLVGTPYGFSDYIALAFLGIGLKPKFLRKYVANNGRMICSQLVDYLFCKVGVHLFDDGRPSQDVTPGDILNRWAIAMDEKGRKKNLPENVHPIDPETQP